VWSQLLVLVEDTQKCSLQAKEYLKFEDVLWLRWGPQHHRQFLWVEDAFWECLLGKYSLLTVEFFLMPNHARLSLDERSEEADKSNFKLKRFVYFSYLSHLFRFFVQNFWTNVDPILFIKWVVLSKENWE